MSISKTIALLAATFVFAFIGTLAGSLVSAHGGDTSLVHSCVDNKGNIRITAPAEVCKAGKETPLDWNIQGPVGPAGPTGPQGPAGSAGSISDHFQEINYSLAPGQTQTIPIPKTDVPVRVEVSVSNIEIQYTEGGQVERIRPLVLHRVFSLESETHGISGSGNNVGYIEGNGPLTVFVVGNEELGGVPGEPDHIVIGSIISSGSGSVTSNVLNYTVHMWY